MKRRVLLAALLSAMGAGQALAQSPATGPKVAVISLIGSELQVLTFGQQVGSRLDARVRQSVTVPDQMFDATALEAAKTAWQRQSPAPADIALFAPTSPALLSNPRALFDQDQLQLPAAMLDGLRREGFDQLLLITRHRQENRLRANNAWVGDGPLEGVGFYVDRYQDVVDAETGAPSRGFLAPYVSLRLSLVALPQAQVIKRQTIGLGHVIGNGRYGGNNPWDALSNKDKVALLTTMIERQVGEHTDKLLQPGR